mgnify:CR=1 FL=1
MAKFNEQIIKECKLWVSENGLMEYGGAKLKDFCSHFNIDSQTYYRWLENADFADAIKKGNKINMKISSRSSHAYMKDLSSPYSRISKLFSNFVSMKLKPK